MSHVVYSDTNDELPMPAVVTITKEVVPRPDLIVMASSVPSDISIAMPTRCLMKCQGRVIGVPTYVSSPNAGAASPPTSTSLNFTLLPKCSLSNTCCSPILLGKIFLGGNVFIQDKLGLCQYLSFPLDRCKEQTIDMGYVLQT